MDNKTFQEKLQEFDNHEKDFEEREPSLVKLVEQRIYPLFEEEYDVYDQLKTIADRLRPTEEFCVKVDDQSDVKCVVHLNTPQVEGNSHVVFSVTTRVNNTTFGKPLETLVHQRDPDGAYGSKWSIPASLPSALHLELALKNTIKLAHDVVNYYLTLLDGAKVGRDRMIQRARDPDKEDDK